MSRSRRRTPILGNTTAASDRAGKRAAHRAVRRDIRQLAQSGRVNDERWYVDDRERSAVCDPWTWPKDGKGYWDAPAPGWERK